MLIGLKNSGTVAGVLLMLAAIVFSAGMFVSESMHTGYNPSRDLISELGVGPGAVFFNYGAILAGLLVIASSFSASFKNIFVFLLTVAAFGLLGVGIFPETMAGQHFVAASVTFIFAGLAAVASYSFSEPPLNKVFLALGALSLCALALFSLQIFLGLGPGGMERLMAYPILIWSLLFGYSLVEKRDLW